MNNLPKEFITVTRLMSELGGYEYVNYFSALKSLSLFKEKFKENRDYIKFISLIEDGKSYDEWNFENKFDLICDIGEEFETIYQENTSHFEYDLEYKLVNNYQNASNNENLSIKLITNNFLNGGQTHYYIYW